MSNRIISPIDNYAEYLAIYCMNVWAKRSIDAIARGLSSPLLEVVDLEGNPLPDHPLAALFKTPNPDYPWSEFIHKHIIDLKATGNAFWEVVENPDATLSLVLHSPVDVEIVLGVRGFIFSYRVDRSREIPAANVLHFREANPCNKYWGLSPMKAAISAIKSDTYSEQFNENFFRNDGTPQTILTPTDDNLSRQEVRRIQEAVDSKAGPKNAGRTEVLPANVKVQHLGVSPKDAQYLEAQKFSREKIGQAFGVNSYMLGSHEDIAYSQADAQIRQFYEQTVLPELKILLERINNFLAPRYDAKFGAARARINNTQVAAMLESTDAMTARVIQMKQNGMLSINEGREMLDVPKSTEEGTDTIFVPVNYTPLHLSLSGVVGNPAGGVGGPVAAPPKSVQDETKNLLRSIHEKDLQDEEQIISKAINRVLVAQGDQAATNLEIGVSPVKVLPSSEDTATKLVEVLRPALLDSMARAASRVLRRGNGKSLEDDLSQIDPDLAALFASNPEAQEVLGEKLLTRLRNSSQKLRESLQERLAELLNEGAGTEALIKEVRKSYADPVHAEKIARTEVAATASVGNQVGFKALGVTHNQWLDSSDSRTRATHIAQANADPVKIGDVFPFTQCRYPGDPNGPAHEAISCRCTILPVLPSELSRNFLAAVKKDLSLLITK